MPIRSPRAASALGPALLLALALGPPGVAPAEPAVDRDGAADVCPLPEGPAPSAVAPESWAVIQRQLDAASQRAGAEGFRTLRVRGHNYARERSGLEAAALEFEAR